MAKHRGEKSTSEIQTVADSAAKALRPNPATLFGEGTKPNPAEIQARDAVHNAEVKLRAVVTDPCRHPAEEVEFATSKLVEAKIALWVDGRLIQADDVADVSALRRRVEAEVLDFVNQNQEGT